MKHAMIVLVQILLLCRSTVLGFPCSPGSIGPGSIPGLGRSSGEGNGNQLQCSCVENPMDRGAWQATVHGVIRVGHELATKPPNDLRERF